MNEKELFTEVVFSVPPTLQPQEISVQIIGIMGRMCEVLCTGQCVH